MKEKILKYMKKYSRDIWNDTNIRFELGEPYDNGTDARIEQVNQRVNSIFEDVFKNNEYIYLYIIDSGLNEDPMFGNTTPDYLYKLLSKSYFEEDIYTEYDEDTDEEGNAIQLTHEFKLKIFYDRVENVPYKEILRGIGNYEQGREPSIAQRVYFISIERDIIFYMYDDRGCIIYSDSKEKLRNLYHKYNDWIVEYWREYIESLFKN